MDLYFDKYQKYKKAEEIINSLRIDNIPYKILDIGTEANEASILEKFLLKDKVNYIDIRQPVGSNSEGFLLKDNEDNLFSDNSYDIVIALEVFEHLEEEKKEAFINELNRISKGFFIIGSTFDGELIVEAINRVNSFYRSIYGGDHPELFRKIKLGLPSLEDTKEALNRREINFKIAPHCEIGLWEEMENAKSLLLYEENGIGALRSISSCYNNHVYCRDAGAVNYMNYIICSRNEAMFNQFDEAALGKVEGSNGDKSLNLINSLLLSSVTEGIKYLLSEMKYKENEFNDRESELLQSIYDKDVHIYNLTNKYKPFYIYKRLKNAILKKKLIMKIKKVLRPFWNIIRKIRIRNIKKAISYARKYGVRALIAKSMDANFMLDYKKWISSHLPSKEELTSQRETKFEYSPKISILVPTYNTPVKYLAEMVDSVILQSYENWELCIADGNSTSEETKAMIKEYSEKDPRIKYIFLRENKGISGNTNEALKLATGDYIGLLDHDDLLTPNALFEVARVINEAKGADVIYSDEDKTDSNTKNYFEPHFKPDYSPDTLRSYNYICHFLVFRKSLIDEVGAFNSKYDGAQDYDLVLRLTETADKIIHIPKILYHWRSHEASTAGNMDAKSYAIEAGKRAISSHLNRIGEKGHVKDGLFVGCYKVDYEIKDNPKVSIIIPNKDETETLRKCIDSITEKTSYSNYEILIVENNSKTKEIFDYYRELEERDNIKVLKWAREFNYSAINNYAVEHAKGEYIILLNNDIEILTEAWIEEMLMFAQREDVGAVGAKLYYPDNTIQHAGVILGIGGVAGHSHKYLRRDENGFIGRLKIVQNLSAVTAACLMTNKKLYQEINGLDENYKIAFNDIDFCMKIREREKLVVFNPYVEMYHYESKSRGLEDTPEKRQRFKSEMYRFKKKWGLWLNDPYYNINLTKEKEDFSLNIDMPKERA